MESTNTIQHARGAPNQDKVCWAMTTGEAGMRSQVLGLADQIGIPFIEQTAKTGWVWGVLPALWVLFGFKIFGLPDGNPRAPWPDILITCGRRSVAHSIYIRQQSRGKTFTVHIQDPKVSARYFDLIAPLDHDLLNGDNVYPTLTAIHPITKLKLSKAVAKNDLPKNKERPLIVVLIGGNSKVYKLSSQLAIKISDQLVAISKANDCDMLVTISRRTGPANAEIFQSKLDKPNIRVWCGTGENPYLSMLATADHIIATCDSVSMISEASATGKPISVIELDGGSAKFKRFHDNMRKAGVTRHLSGDKLGSWTYEPIDETSKIARIVLDKISARE